MNMGNTKKELMYSTYKLRRGSSKMVLVLLIALLVLVPISACTVAENGENGAPSGKLESSDSSKNNITDEGVINTENMKIELIENRCILNTLILKFKVTANLMDSVLFDNGWAEHLNNYMFGGDTFTVDMGDYTKLVSYIYSNEDSSLEPNQLYYDYLMIKPEPITSGDYNFRFSGFGSYPKVNSGKIEVLYDEEWDFPVKIFNVDDGGKVLQTEEKLLLKGEEFSLSRAIITPPAITLSLSSESGSAGVESFSGVDVSVKLKNGNVLLPTIVTADIKDFSVSVLEGGHSASGWNGSCIVVFNEEINPDDIATITIGDNSIDLAG